MLWMEKNAYRIKLCGRCSVAYTDLAPTGDDLRQRYDERYFTDGGAGYAGYVSDEPMHRRQARRLLATLEKRGITRGRLLDVGCAAGFFIDEAAKRGWEVEGCEISAYAAAYARDALQRKVQCTSFLEANLRPGSIDLVTFLNVFEHLPDPRETVARLDRIVRRGGHVLIETWDRKSLVARLFGRRWHQYSPPSVLFFFDKPSLTRLFHPDAWMLESWNAATKWLSLAHAHSLLRYVAGARAPATELGETWLRGVGIPYRAGDLVVALFRRV